MTNEMSGSCLCGKVKLSIEANHNPKIGACHCGMCRKWTAGPFMSIDYNGEPSFEGQEFIQYYTSSEWAQRAFCRECGTSLFYRLKNTNQYYIASWIFDNLKNLHFKNQIYIDQKPECYNFAEQTLNLTEADILAMFVAPAEE